MTRLLISAFVFLQSVISVKPGFVGLADGTTNVQEFEHVPPGKTVQTGPRSHVEMGLGLDSLLRLDENSAAVIESFDMENVSVRIQSGSALVEVPKIEKGNRIHVAVGNIKALIDSKGVFRFSGDTVSVMDGRLKIDGGSVTVQKGWQLTNSDGKYRQSKLVLTTPAPFKSFLNSPRAGFVNALQGEVNVQAFEVARQDQPIKTGPASYAEILLSPGSFMRVDESSEVVIDSAGFSDIVVEVRSGSVLIESVAADPRFPIRVSVGDAKPIISSPGLYRFTSETATVIDGSIEIGQKGASAFAGTAVRFVNKQYHTEDVPADPEQTGLDLWSAGRSQLLARANLMGDYSDAYANFFLFVSPAPYVAAWMYSPSLNGITFVPRSKRESYYKTSFVPLYTLVPHAPVPPSTPMRIPTPNLPRPPSSTPAPATSAPAPAPAPPAPAPTAPTSPPPKPTGK
jgi:ferric-dicitrate binding protein FerR (iron transport regulator)